MEAAWPANPASTRKSAGKPKAAPPRGGSNRDKAVAALMALLAEQPFEQIGLAEVAGRAGLSLSATARRIRLDLAILAAHIKEIDRAVLDGGDADMAEDPAARAAVRGADAPARSAGALQGGGALAAALGAPQSRPGASRSTAWRCARSNGC